MKLDAQKDLRKAGGRPNWRACLSLRTFAGLGLLASVAVLLGSLSANRPVLPQTNSFPTTQSAESNEQDRSSEPALGLTKTEKSKERISSSRVATEVLQPFEAPR